MIHSNKYWSKLKNIDWIPKHITYAISYVAKYKKYYVYTLVKHAIFA